MRVPSVVPPRVGDAPRHGGCGRHGRTGQVDLRVGAAHAPRVVAVAHGDDALARGDNAVLASQAGPATGVHDQRAGLDDGLDPTAAQRLGVDAPRCRHHDRPRVGVDGAPGEVAGHHLHVLEATVGAAADVHLVDRGPLDVGDVVDVVRGRGHGHLRLQVAHIDVQDIGVVR